ncbi:MAG: hypothetical protein GX766_08440, partial [Firmicutes bacterium]|nr:hypothetical protein [Bacillota bacterium]
MKARLILFTLLISLLAFALPTVRAGKAVDLSGFSGQHRDVVYENNQLRLKVDGSVGEIIDFSDPSSLNKFTQGENGDYWTIVDGRAKVEKEGVTRLPDGKKYELKITRNTDSLTVKYNVGSEKGYDWFKVKKGNDVILSASGQAEDEKTLVFPEGEYEFTISYEKDECGRSMPDTVELDYIKFGGGSTKTAIVETAFQYGEGAYRWTEVNIDYTGNVTVQLATSFDGKKPSNWINYTSGTPALPISRYLHIKLVLSSSGDETLVRGITVTAEPDSKAPEVTFLNLQSQYSSIPTNLQVRLIDPSGIKTGADGSKVEVFKGSRPIPIASEFSTTDGGQTVTFKVSVIEEASQLEPGYYTIRVTAVDELGNKSPVSWTFFLGTDLAIEPGFVIVPSGMKQGFQV